MNIGINFTSLFVIIIYFYTEFSKDLSGTSTNAEFLGLSLIYTSIPIVAMALVVGFVKNEIRAKNWKHVAGTVKNIDVKSIFGTRKYKIEYQYYVNDIGYVGHMYSNRKSWSSLGQLMLNNAFRNGNPESWIGKRVKVYFNNDDIWDSMLEQNARIDFDMTLVPAITMISILSYAAYVIIF